MGQTMYTIQELLVSVHFFAICVCVCVWFFSLQQKSQKLQRLGIWFSVNSIHDISIPFFLFFFYVCCNVSNTQFEIENKTIFLVILIVFVISLYDISLARTNLITLLQNCHYIYPL